MKKQSFLMAGVLVLSSMAATQVARAQETMVVDIPFAFTAGNATLPAGEYRVEKKKCRNWLATRRKPKLRWLPACPPPGRDVTPAPMATQRTGSRSPQLRLPFL